MVYMMLFVKLLVELFVTYRSNVLCSVRATHATNKRSCVSCRYVLVPGLSRHCKERKRCVVVYMMLGQRCWSNCLSRIVRTFQFCARDTRDKQT